MAMATKSSFLIVLILLSISYSLVHSIEFNFPAFFNFGDSNSDSGCLVATGIETLDPPNGQSFFGDPSGRYSDGRLIIDFLLDAMDMPFLNAYLDSTDRRVSEQDATLLSLAPPYFLPLRGGSAHSLLESKCLSFFVSRPVSSNFWGKVSIRHAGKKTDQYLPAEDYFGRGLYLFDIGQNDLGGAFYSKSFDQIIASIPFILIEFETGIKTLYDQGTRNFWIHNTGPLGCLPQNIARFGTDPSKLDELGCVSAHNQAARLFNLQLHALCTKLRAQYADANITHVDIYTIKTALIANYSRYGFEQPIMACCGYGGGALNYDSRIACGQKKVINGTSVTAKACDDSNEYVNWDGIHYTEAANQFVTSQILTGRYSNPPFADKMPFHLKLKF